MNLTYYFDDTHYVYEANCSEVQQLSLCFLQMDEDIPVDDIEYYAENLDDIESDFPNVYEALIDHLIEHFENEAHSQYNEEQRYKNPYSFYGVNENEF